MRYSDCCGARIWNQETDICSECREHCDDRDTFDEQNLRALNALKESLVKNKLNQLKGVSNGKIL